jgi:putative two-component system response regulator
LSDLFLSLFRDKEQLAAEHQLLISSISSLVTALEARDTYTRGHSENVSMIVEGIARMMHIPADTMETVVVGARLHDIGKIGIRDALLFNTDPLTPEEYAIIKEHPRIGAMILKPIASLAEAIEIVYSHHERWDGKGYPRGLQGDAIPFWARIAAVADTFDALTSTRSYQKGRSIPEAVELIRTLSGKQLAPNAVDLFMQWMATHPAVIRRGAG